MYTQDTGNLKITKKISGLPEGEVPEDLSFNVSSEAGYDEDYTLADDFEYDEDEDIYVFVIEGLAVGEYTVEESGTDYPDYTLAADTETSIDVEVEKDETAEAEFENVYTRDTADLKIIKVVDPDDITVPETAEFTITGPKDFGEDGKMTVTYKEFTDNEYLLEGVPTGEYSVEEEGAEVVDYTLNTTYSATAENPVEVKTGAEKPAEITVTNTYTRITKDIEVFKIWDDDYNEEDDYFGFRPESIDFTVIGKVDGETVVTYDVTLEDNGENTWTAVVTVNATEGGEDIVYEVDEDETVLHIGYVKEIDSLTITNIFEPCVGDPPVKKVIETEAETVPEETFTFQLEAKDESYPMPEGASGTKMTVDIKMPAAEGEDWKEFGEIIFTEPGTYVYEITEIPGEAAGFTYDDNVITITYVVKPNEDTHALEVTKTVDNKNTGETQVLEGKESGNIEYFIFTNEYTEIPETGDSSNPGLWAGTMLVSMLGLLYVALESRKKTGKHYSR